MTIGRQIARANQTLAESEVRFRTMADASPALIWVADVEGKRTWFNKTWLDTTGQDLEDSLGSGWIETVDAEDKGRVQQAVTNQVKNQSASRLEYRLVQKDGSRRWILDEGRPRRDSVGLLLGYIGSCVDITERLAAEEEIKSLAFLDVLTKLPNRRLLLDRLGQALASGSRRGCEGALLFIDLDNFKTLNDNFGHDMGDLLLQQVAHRLTSCVRQGDTVARLGGDEFVVMLENLSENPKETAAQIKIVAEKILAALNQPYTLGSLEHHSSASIGAALFEEKHESLEELVKRADTAMYQAKAAGRNTLCFFDPDLQAAVKARASMEEDLRQAIKNEQFLLFFQPQMDGGRVVGAEALIRWMHPERGIVLPGEFIPLAEETGLILPLGRWVLETACAQISAWAGRKKTSDITVAVNVSAREFRQPDFVEQVLAALIAAEPIRKGLSWNSPKACWWTMSKTSSPR